MSWIKDIFEIKKLPTIFFLAIAVAGAFVFYGGDAVLVKFKHGSEKETYAYVIWLIACVLLVTNIITFIIRQIRIQIITWKVKADYRNTLDTLDPFERSVIREFFLCNKFTLDFPFDNSVITGLVNKHVLMITSPLGQNSFIVQVNGSTTYSLNKYMRKQINPQTFFGLSRNPSNHEMDDIEKNRPYFLKQNNF